jgi:collagenase-like PrtC family protease
MAEFCVPTNYSKTYLNKLVDLNNEYSDKVTEVFGSFKTNFIGHARESIAVQPITKKQLQEHAKYAQSKGIKFNLVLNSIYTPHIENTKKGREKLEKLCKYIKKAKFDSVTLASPFLMYYFTKNHPEIKLKISCGTEPYSVEALKKYAEFNPEVIVWNRKLNRAFPLLKAVPDNIRDKIELVVNSRCINQCPFSVNHLLSSSYSSASNKKHGKPSYPFYSICCTLTALNDPIEIIKSPWIRPEDISAYERAGVTKFKLDGRGKSEEKLVETVKAYLSRHYSGNLLDLAGNPHLREAKYYLDNKKLDGFIKNFENSLCITKDCNHCGICKHYSKFVQRDSLSQKNLLDKFISFKNILLTNKPSLKFERDKSDWIANIDKGFIGSPIKIMEKYSMGCGND